VDPKSQSGHGGKEKNTSPGQVSNLTAPQFKLFLYFTFIVWI